MNIFNQNQFIEVKIIKHFVNEAEDPSFIKKRESNDSRKHLLSPRILKKSSKKQNTQSEKQKKGKQSSVKCCMRRH